MTNSVPRIGHALTAAQMEELVDHLRGSCGSLTGALLSHFGIEEDALTHRDTAELDSMLFLCDGCGWWCDVEELHSDQTCAECADDGDDE